MNDKDRFELFLTNSEHFEIVDWKETLENSILTVYNDLGVHPFSSAPSLCILLNELENEHDDYCKHVKNVLIKHYEFARERANENLDDVIVYEAYNLLAHTICLIGEELGVKIL